MESSPIFVVSFSPAMIYDIFPDSFGKKRFICDDNFWILVEN